MNSAKKAVRRRKWEAQASCKVSQKITLGGFPVPPGPHPPAQRRAAPSGDSNGDPRPGLWTVQAQSGPLPQPPGSPGRGGHRSPSALTVGRRSSAMRAALGRAVEAQPPESPAPLGVSGLRHSPPTARSAIQIPRRSRPIGWPHSRRALPTG